MPKPSGLIVGRDESWIGRCTLTIKPSHHVVGEGAFFVDWGWEPRQIAPGLAPGITTGDAVLDWAQGAVLDGAQTEEGGTNEGCLAN